MQDTTWNINEACYNRVITLNKENKCAKWAIKNENYKKLITTINFFSFKHFSGNGRGPQDREHPNQLKRQARAGRGHRQHQSRGKRAANSGHRR